MGYSRSREKGNLSGPLTTALDSLKDLRDQIRFVLDEGLLTNDESQKVVVALVYPVEYLFVSGTFC